MKISIQTVNMGAVEVDAPVVRNGLAIHRIPIKYSIFDEPGYVPHIWTITHVESGQRVCSTTTRAKAQRLLTRITSLADWTKDAQTLKSDKTLAEKVKGMLA